MFSVYLKIKSKTTLYLCKLELINDFASKDSLSKSFSFEVVNYSF